MSAWTTQQVEALAPDASSAKAGKGLATASKWKNLGANEQALWGECQGSGKVPYQTQVDLSEPAFRCTCPSHKFPCKHSLGLMLLWAAQPGALKDQSAPDWVTGWLESRVQKAAQKAEKLAQKVERAAQPVDPAAQAKRAAQRETKVAGGLDYVETWLHDLVRVGLTSLPGQPYSYWETPAARMVDAQAPGLGRMIRELSPIASSGAGWQERLLARAGRLYLLIEGFRRLETLPEPVQADIRSLIGWKIAQEDLLALPPEAGVRDRWLVTGQRVEDDGQVRTQRTWLRGQETGRPALALQFAAFGQVLERSLAPGSTLDAELVFYPSAYPLRALLRQRHDSPATPAPPCGYGSVTAALEAYTAALAELPWLEEFPLPLEGVVPLNLDGQWLLRDEAGHVLPIAPDFTRGWHLLALSGGHPVTIFGEWDGDTMMPLSLWVGGEFHPLLGAS